ncbi:MAG: NAD(P)-dependent glycerol-1-phosphate dehydrogenase [Nitrososphaerales archaeon]
MELPRRVVVGDEIISEMGEILEALEIGRSSLIVCGPNVKKLVGTDLAESLEEKRFNVDWEISGASTFEEVERISEISKKKKSSFLIGVGGGRSIDIAKLASFNCKLPFVSVPTSASHDGISSPFASVKGLDRPYSVVARPPIGIVADTAVISRAPFHLLISGCGDLVSKRTAVRDWILSHERTGEYFGGYSANLALLSADLIIDNARSIAVKEQDSVRVVVEALISSGVAAGIAGSSRPCSGSEHLFSHAMDLVAPKKGMHGEKCGIGSIMMAKLHGIDHEQIKTSLATIGAPTSAKEIGATEEEIVKALVLAKDLRKERYTILNEAKLDHASARKLAEDTRVL